MDVMGWNDTVGMQMTGNGASKNSIHPTLVLPVGDGLEGWMSNYRRYRVAGGTYFFTVVTESNRGEGSRSNSVVTGQA